MFSLFEAMKKLLFLLLLCFTLTSVYAVSEDLRNVKRHLYESYLRVVNQDRQLIARIEEIGQKSGSPDMMIRELSENVTDDEIGRLLSRLQDDGSWTDIDYADKNPSGWTPSFHVQRIMFLARAYRNSDSRYFRNRELGIQIHTSFHYWFTGNFTCPNWWYNSIGVPKMLGVALILMEDELTGAEKKAGIKCLEHAQIGMTGQNRIWLAANVLIRSLLAEDEALFREAYQVVVGGIVVSGGEGIQPDWSFHQHGAQQQFGNYGLAYMNEMAYWARVFSDTGYALNETQLDILRNYLFQGVGWMLWKGNLDVSSCNRQLFRYAQEGKAISLGKAIRNMESADPRYRKMYRRLYKEHVLTTGHNYSCTGNRYFWRSDMAVQRSASWMATLKMSSTRVIGSEIINAENLMGHYLGDGVLCVYRNGDEYRDIFPVWDWTKLPGVTCYSDPGVIERNRKTFVANGQEWVGGISDGRQGIATMVLNKDSVTGYKSWFFLRDMIVCLGSGIEGKKPDEITTTVNQCLSRGEVLYVGSSGTACLEEESLRSDELQGVYHDGVGYIFTEKQDITLLNKEQRGNWCRVAAFYDTTEVSRKVFTAYITNRDGRYAYIELPGITGRKFTRKLKNPGVEILRNDSCVQAVADADGKTALIVFFQSGEVKLKGGRSVIANKPCVLMVKRGKKQTVLMSEPTGKVKGISVLVTGDNKSSGL